MNPKNGLLAIGGSLVLFAGAVSASPSLQPSVTTAEGADQMIVIKDNTKHINVFENQTILFKSHDNQFAVKFDGVKHEYDLAKIAPVGMLDHKVRVYVAAMPSERD